MLLLSEVKWLLAQMLQCKEVRGLSSSIIHDHIRTNGTCVWERQRDSSSHRNSLLFLSGRRHHSTQFWWWPRTLASWVFVCEVVYGAPWAAGISTFYFVWLLGSELKGEYIGNVWYTGRVFPPSSSSAVAPNHLQCFAASPSFPPHLESPFAHVRYQHKSLPELVGSDSGLWRTFLVLEITTSNNNLSPAGDTHAVSQSQPAGNSHSSLKAIAASCYDLDLLIWYLSIKAYCLLHVW